MPEPGTRRAPSNAAWRPLARLLGAIGHAMLGRPRLKPNHGGWLVERLVPPLRRFRVVDTSMQPGLRPGDRLLVGRWLAPRVGDIVVLRDPEAPATFVIKRIQSFTAEGTAIVRGDNPNVSRDSRQFGPVPRALIVGRAVFRYLPAQRRGGL